MSFTFTSELCTVLYVIFSTLLTGLIDTALQYALQLPVYGSVCGQGRNKFCVPFCAPHVDARLPSPHVRHLLSRAHRIERTVDDMTRLALRIYETTRSGTFARVDVSRRGPRFLVTASVDMVLTALE